MWTLIFFKGVFPIYTDKQEWKETSKKWSIYMDKQLEGKIIKVKEPAWTYENCPMSKNPYGGSFTLWSYQSLLFKTAPEATHHLTRGWTKNNEEWTIPRVGSLDKITVNCYHGSKVSERLMVKGVEQRLLLGVIGSRTNLAQQPHRGDMVHSGSNWSFPFLRLHCAPVSNLASGNRNRETSKVIGVQRV